jgi:glycosyltransferase A (GT-A) superfamily protein (DUF2064 family)
MLVKGDHPALFFEMPWSTSGVLTRTLEAASGAGLTVSRLPALTDVDEAGDLMSDVKIFDGSAWRRLDSL